jgi:hypothetical protein
MHKEARDDLIFIYQLRTGLFTTRTFTPREPRTSSFERNDLLRFSSERS